VERLLPTPSQTVGPYFALELPRMERHELVASDDPDHVRVRGIVFDGEGTPVDDAVIEIWQANRAGRYDHPEDTREDVPLEEGFEGWGRCATDDGGHYEFVTVKPGPVPAPGGGMQAPHLEVSVLARGVLVRLATRIYFPDEAEANAADAVLSSVPEDARERLVAVQEDGGLRFDIHLQGDHETPFFAV
jgi:protocatechuate 3,4-dioxygenase, alpha subunit